MTDYRVQFIQREQAELVAFPFDPTPAPGQIVGENIVSLISSGSERGGFTQQFPAESYPMDTGSSSIARVLAVGEGVTGFKPGDLVYHGEHHTRYVKVDQGDAFVIPEGKPVEQLIFGRYAAVSMSSTCRMKSMPVDQVVVTGQGMVGAMCAAVLQNCGYIVYAVDPSEQRREVSLQMGLKHVGASLSDLGVEKNSCGALLECSGNEAAIRDALDYLRFGADVFQVGVPWKQYTEWSARDLLYRVFYGYISLHGGWEWDVIPRKSDRFHYHSSSEHMRQAMQMIADGRITIPEIMYELRDPRDCNAVYSEITVPRLRPTSMILDWRKFKEEQV